MLNYFQSISNSFTLKDIRAPIEIPFSAILQNKLSRVPKKLTENTKQKYV